MPVQTSPPSFPDSFPSFMSVYGGLPPRFEEETSCHLHPSPHFPINPSSRRLHPTHRESVSSSASASTESSPTTTISPFDSPSGGDISPSSSPESPSAMPLSYPKFTPPARALEVATRPTMSDSSRLLPAPQTARPPSPGRRARNLKNLSLRMPPPTQSRPPIATASLVETSSSHLSAPPSPIQIPQKSNRRRPAGLTIQTPSFKQSFSGPEIVPPTPTLGRQSLRHAESSPSLASITSPGFAPRGGMSLPRPTSHHGSRRFSATPDDVSSSLATIPDSATISHRVLDGLEEEDDHIDSRESTKKHERGYPDGPIRIHDEGVYLYLEPTAEEASKFDVVINVAKEVRNPFNKDQTERNDTVMSTWRNASMASKRYSIDDPQTAMSEVSFKSAFEYLPSDSESATPTTPTPRSAATPEYLHVGWDHNSEILDDLLPLCELIDERISQGKKVLVHCQLGASRSASLVIAYGLYKNRHMDFNSMYEVVKGRSQWVGPNMSLIYQLTDFRGRLMRGSPSRPAPREWFVQGGGRRCSEPQFPREDRAPAEETPRPAFRGLSQAPSMGCLSIPSSSPARPKTSDNGNRSPKRSLSPRPLPFRQKFQSVGPAPGRPRGVPRSVSSCDPLVQTHVFVRDAPEQGAGIFSPRTSGFLSPPPIPPPSRGIAHVADITTATKYTNETADPRSPPPPAGGERMIMRNIDEFL